MSALPKDLPSLPIHLVDSPINWRPLPPGALPSPRSHIPTDEEVISAIAYVWCIHWNSFSTMDSAGLRARILARQPSWHLLDNRVADIRARALADGRLRRPAFEAGLRMQPSMEEIRLREHAYDFDPRWRTAKRAQAKKLAGSFEITSGTSFAYWTQRHVLPLPLATVAVADLLRLYTGEVVWGQLAAFVSGMKSSSRDVEYLNNPRVSPWRFRAAARPGIWHVRLTLFPFPPPSPSIMLTAVCHPSILLPNRLHV
jgi:hypothetical protein